MSIEAAITPTHECPPEALVLLDEAIEALPAGCILRTYGKSEGYIGPGLSSLRSMGDDIFRLTWTVSIDGPKLNTMGYLEWWDDHWVRIDYQHLQGPRQVLWCGRRMVDE